LVGFQIRRLSKYTRARIPLEQQINEVIAVFREGFLANEVYY